MIDGEIADERWGHDPETTNNRMELKALIEKNGGKNTGSVSAKTSFVLAGEGMGPSKREKAEKLGVQIISEREFEALLE